MDFATPDILECPHCGGLRRISYSVFDVIDDTLWSDFMSDWSLPSVSRVLKCPVCKKYHFYHRSQIIGDCKSYFNSDFGELSYESLKEALEQLKPQGKDEETLRMMLLWAYNDLYGQMHNVEILPEELQRERQFFKENALALFRLRPEDTLLHAELLRELGDFDKSITILKKICIEQPSMHAITIIQKAANKDANVCLIESGRFSEPRYPTRDSKGYIYNPWKDRIWYWGWVLEQRCNIDYISYRIRYIIDKIKYKLNLIDKYEDEW